MRARGFTLIELMIVVVIVGLVGAMAAMTTRSTRGEQAPAFARSLLSMTHEARHQALALGLPTRLRLQPATPRMQLVFERQDPTNNANWIADGTATAPNQVELCTVSAAAVLGTVSPVCPLAAATMVCFAPNGQTSVTANATCPGAAPSGATIFLHTTDAQPKQLKIVIFGLTGLPRLMDTW
jgi:prepilin-type N-terminal cleavage/methylation domain-containing protein